MEPLTWHGFADVRVGAVAGGGEPLPGGEPRRRAAVRAARVARLAVRPLDDRLAASV